MLNQSGKLMNIFQTILQNHKLCCVLVQYCVLVPVWCGEGGCILGLAWVLTGRCARAGAGVTWSLSGVSQPVPAR